MWTRNRQLILKQFYHAFMSSFYPIMVKGYAALISSMAVVQASDSMTASM